MGFWLTLVLTFYIGMAIVSSIYFLVGRWPFRMWITVILFGPAILLCVMLSRRFEDAYFDWVDK